MSDSPYASYFTPGCVYVTCATFGRQAVLKDPHAAHLLESVLSDLGRRYGFQTAGHVILPEHAHLLLNPGAGVTLDRIMHSLFAVFERGYLEMMGLPHGAPVWQRAYHAARVEGLEEFADRLDYIHYNPVHHGLVARPEEWLQSSYGVWIERKVYKLGWGWVFPENLIGKRWE